MAGKKDTPTNGPAAVEAEVASVREGVVAAPEPGTDPDSRQRLAKTLVASGVDLPDGLSTDPVTDKDREASVKAAEKRREGLTKQAESGDDAGDDTKDAATRARHTTPQGRSTTPHAKTS